MKRSFQEWVKKWKRRAKVIWKDPTMRGQRTGAIIRARRDIGKEPKYALLPKFGDSSTMNCESFVRACYLGKYNARSSQSERFTDSLHDGKTDVTVWGRLATGINAIVAHYQRLLSVARHACNSSKLSHFVVILITIITSRILILLRKLFMFILCYFM